MAQAHSPRVYNSAKLGRRAVPTGKPEITMTWFPDSTAVEDSNAASTLEIIDSTVDANGTRNGVTPQRMFRRRKVVGLGVKAYMGTSGRLFDMSSAVRPDSVKTVIPATLRS